MRYLLILLLVGLPGCFDQRPSPSKFRLDSLEFGDFCYEEATDAGLASHPGARLVGGTEAIGFTVVWESVRVGAGSPNLFLRIGTSVLGAGESMDIERSRFRIDVLATAAPAPAGERLAVVFTTRSGSGKIAHESREILVGCGAVPRFVDAPRVVMDGGGNAVVAYTDGGGVFARAYRDGAGWQPDVAVSAGAVDAVRIATDGPRSATLVWADDGQVFAADFDGTARAPVRLDALGPSRGPRIASHGATDFAVWEDLSGAATAARRLPGQPWTPPEPVDADGPSQPVLGLTVAIGAFGRGVAAWSRTTPTPGGLATGIFVAHHDGVTWLPPQLLDSSDADGTGSVDLAFNPSGDGFAVYRKGDRAVVARHDRDAGWLTPVPLDDGNGIETAPRVVVNAAGLGVAVWLRDNDVRVSRFAVASGWGPVATIGEGRRPVPALDEGGHARIVWEDAGIWSAEFRDTWQAAVRIGDGARPDLAMDASGRAVAAWADGLIVRTRVWDGVPSAAGASVVFATDRDGQWEIYRHDDGFDQRLTHDAAADTSPAWSPNRQRIAFVSDRDNPGTSLFELYVMDADGTNAVRLTGVTEDGGFTVLDPAWSPDGTTIAFVLSRPQTAPAIYTVPATQGPPNLLLERANAAAIASPTWSPDGLCIAYEEDGEIFVFDADAAIPVPTKLVDGSDPDWFGDAIAFTRAGDLFRYDVGTTTETALLTGADDDVAPAFAADGGAIYFVRRTIAPRVMRLADGTAAEIPGQTADGLAPDG